MSSGTLEEEAGGSPDDLNVAVELQEVTASSGKITSAPGLGLMRAVGKSKSVPLSQVQTPRHSVQVQEFKSEDWWRWIPGVSLALHFYYFDVRKESALLYYEVLALVTTLLLGFFSGIATAYTMEEWEQFRIDCESDAQYSDCVNCREAVIFFGQDVLTGGYTLYMSLFCIFILYVTAVLGQTNDDVQFAAFFRVTLPVQMAPLLLTLCGLVLFSKTLENVVGAALPNYAFQHGACQRHNSANFDFTSDLGLFVSIPFTVISTVWIMLGLVRYKGLLIHEPKCQQREDIQD